VPCVSLVRFSGRRSVHICVVSRCARYVGRHGASYYTAMGRIVISVFVVRTQCVYMFTAYAYRLRV